MTNTQKETAEAPVPVYLTKRERSLLRVLAAKRETSMSKVIRTLVRRELDLRDDE
jgi:hypothetical protein